MIMKENQPAKKILIVDDEPDILEFLKYNLRKEGYEEAPLDELQDRLSKLQGPLADIILKGRG